VIRRAASIAVASLIEMSLRCLSEKRELMLECVERIAKPGESGA
jgi:hypothetical protein